jgi:methylglutaconyl-CoA hydratase
MSQSKVLYETKEGIARITLNRPEKRNALDGELVGELKEAMASSANDEQCRVVLLTGSGTDFCSGADLAGLEKSAQAGVLETRAEARNVADLFLMMRNHPRPILAGVHGRALAGGCGIATACDIILAGASAQFGYPEVNIGFVPAMVMAILRRSISEKAAFELIATGEIIPASRAKELGLIHRVFADDQFTSEVNAFAAKLAAKSPSALTLCKSLLYNMDSMSFEAALAAGVDVNAIARMTEDCRRGVERFLKKS